ncbi:hypothetical protein F5878DRAFT_582842 [Lentinula raphanica]|uniref:Uncharacterized protein n=1 Tax=Lentinula raphanica TaxID=153919 RepID=A0AA38P9F7_9AGAR|nr:hypothetical protein C8R42DRAFT_642638 [Lentinula raphanica]KAJ3838764.1 hypothetical protein F5878DRAFT_582842 [Lentinula raphanica]
MISTKVFSAVFAALVGAQAVSAAALAPATITVCTGAGNPPQGCVTIPVVSDECTDFTGGLSFLNKEVTIVEVPDGFVCTFYEAFGCFGTQNTQDAVVLTSGTWDMSSVPGIASTVNFNDMASSFTCSPL